VLFRKESEDRPQAYLLEEKEITMPMVNGKSYSYSASGKAAAAKAAKKKKKKVAKKRRK
tara:strand:- start:3657 stop:3833 length:177 start_codon:yes stop_codon:yes gene_type:complete